MAAVTKSCDVQQAFNFNPDSQATVGHVTMLKIGTMDLTADQEIGNPLDIKGEKVAVVAPCYSVSWEGGEKQPLMLDMEISVKNWQKAAMLVHQELSNTEVLVQFNVYDYDPVAKSWYKSFHSKDADLKGLILKSGSALDIEIADEPRDDW